MHSLSLYPTHFFVNHDTTDTRSLSHPQVKILAAVLLRRLFLQSADELVRVDVAILQACRSELLMAIQTEESAPVRRKICDAVAELARASIGIYTLILVFSSQHVVIFCLVTR